ncbi:MAG: hypothetical protein ACLPNY_03545, partial [Roseiarcus sp.]
SPLAPMKSEQARADWTQSLGAPFNAKRSEHDFDNFEDKRSGRRVVGRWRRPRTAVQFPERGP